MNRYLNINITDQLKTDDTLSQGFINVKYPEIPRDFSDIYVYTSRGDRYDTLSQQYYGDHTLWWIISRANSSQTPDSLVPDIGSNIRIPGVNRILDILDEYKKLNKQTSS